MSWLNLNQSLSSLKGQITNFASEVLSEIPAEDPSNINNGTDSKIKELEDKCRDQELEIASLKKLNDELQASLQSERLSRKNGIREDESSWYWDPAPQTSKPADNELENHYKVQIRALQDELSTMKERATIDLQPDVTDEVNRLKEENQNLTANLEDLDNQHQQAMERLLSLKKELQKNFEVLKQEHEELKNANDEYDAEIKSLLLKIGERDKEIESLKAAKSDFDTLHHVAKSDFDTLHHKYQNLERIHSLLRENAEKFQEENQDLHEEVFKLQEQVTKLEHELEESISKHTEPSDIVPREKYEELLKELHDLRNKRNSNQVHLDEINIDDNAKSVIENLKREIIDLKHKLNNLNDHPELDSKTIKSEKVMQLYNKYINFELPVDYVGEIPSPGDNIVMYKLESVFKTINSFKKEIDSLAHQLSEKNLNTNHLQTQIDDLTTENDFLTTDIQHYERELNEMKKNNDFLISEIAALKNTSKLEPIIETHEDNLAKLETELADCNRINKSFEAEIKQIEKELNEVRAEKVVLQESLNDLRTKYSTMLTELELFKNQSREVEELEKTCNEQKDEKIKIYTEEIHDLKKRLAASNAKNEQLAIDIHIIENDKVLLTKELDELRNTLKEKSSEHKELTVLKVALDSKLEDLEKKLDEVIKHKDEIEDDRLNLQQKVTELKNATSKDSLHITKKIEILQTDKSSLSEKLSNVTAENSTLSEMIENLKDEINKLKQQGEKLAIENASFNDSKSEQETLRLLQEAQEELKAKHVQEEFLNNEILALKEENEKLVERKLQLETELSNTDNKIVHLEQEFDKLIADLNEKDTLINNLNSTVTSNNASLQTLNQNVSDLENTLTVKNKEIERLQHSLEDVHQKLKESDEKANRTNEELQKLHNEKEDISKQIFALHDEIVTKNKQISDITLQIEELSRIRNDQASTIDVKDKEIKELNQSIVELTDKLKVTENITHHNDEYARLVQEKETIEIEVVELKNAVVVKDKELLELKGKCEQLEKACVEYKTILDNSTAEKNELINLINLKHNESIQYHNEIQRLNHVLLEQTNEFKKALEEKDHIVQNYTESCQNCERLRVTLKEKDEIIMGLTQTANDYDRLKEELRVLSDKCDNLDKSLAIQLETVKKLTAENAQLSEQEQNSSRELERLRHHLVEMEESYTQELMTSEQKLTECQARLHQVEERAKQTSTVYTSNSIRANQEVETLRNQIKLLEKQREEVQGRLGEAEDARSRSEAALTNLQVVLEQFQQDKDRDISAATEKIRNKMEDLKRENSGLRDEISRLNAKLDEALAGLQAASRLGDQVETKTAQINDLKEQVKTLQISVSAAEDRYYNAISNQQDKVDKHLVKNLVINYVINSTNNNNNKTQVLRILSTVLDFNQQECERLGLARSTTTPDSLAAEFVRFLQNESRPRAPLPDMMALTQPPTRSATPASRKSSTIGSHPFEPGHKRNPSTGSNNLLFQNLDDSRSQRSDTEPRVVGLDTGPRAGLDTGPRAGLDTGPRVGMDTGVTQTRSSEGAILKHALRDM